MFTLRKLMNQKAAHLHTARRSFTSNVGNFLGNYVEGDHASANRGSSTKEDHASANRVSSTKEVSLSRPTPQSEPRFYVYYEPGMTISDKFLARSNRGPEFLSQCEIVSKHLMTWDKCTSKKNIRKIAYFELLLDCADAVLLHVLNQISTRHFHLVNDDEKVLICGAWSEGKHLTPQKLVINAQLVNYPDEGGIKLTTDGQLNGLKVGGLGALISDDKGNRLALKGKCLVDDKNLKFLKLGTADVEVLALEMGLEMVLEKKYKSRYLMIECDFMTLVDVINSRIRLPSGDTHFARKIKDVDTLVRDLRQLGWQVVGEHVHSKMNVADLICRDVIAGVEMSAMEVRVDERIIGNADGYLVF